MSSDRTMKPSAALTQSLLPLLPETSATKRLYYSMIITIIMFHKKVKHRLNPGGEGGQDINLKMLGLRKLLPAPHPTLHPTVRKVFCETELHHLLVYSGAYNYANHSTPQPYIDLAGPTFNKNILLLLNSNQSFNNT